MSDVRPRRGIQVDRPLAEPGVERPRFTQVGQLDPVPGLLQLGLEQVGHGQAVAPGGDEAQAESLAPAAGTLTAGGQGARRRQGGQSSGEGAAGGLHGVPSIRARRR